MSEDPLIFTPMDLLHYEARCRGLDEKYFRVPDRMIILYQDTSFRYARRLLRGRILDWFFGDANPVCVGVVDGEEIGVSRIMVGAPAAASVLEMLIACGAEKVYEAGVAGSLQPWLGPGEIVVVTDAFRDEGTSNHYFEPEIGMSSSPNLRDLLIQSLNRNEIKHQIGPVWTTDGVFRETRGKLQRFRGRGALAVNMETSALFAVAKHHNIDVASAQVISDVLSEQGWRPALKDPKVSESLRTLVKLMTRVLAEP